MGDKKTFEDLKKILPKGKRKSINNGDLSDVEFNNSNEIDENKVVSIQGADIEEYSVHYPEDIEYRDQDQELKTPKFYKGQETKVKEENDEDDSDYLFLDEELEEDNSKIDKDLFLGETAENLPVYEDIDLLNGEIKENEEVFLKYLYQEFAIEYNKAKRIMDLFGKEKVYDTFDLLMRYGLVKDFDNSLKHNFFLYILFTFKDLNGIDFNLLEAAKNLFLNNEKLTKAKLKLKDFEKLLKKKIENKSKFEKKEKEYKVKKDKKLSKEKKKEKKDRKKQGSKKSKKVENNQKEETELVNGQSEEYLVKEIESNEEVKEEKVVKTEKRKIEKKEKLEKEVYTIKEFYKEKILDSLSMNYFEKEESELWIKIFNRNLDIYRKNLEKLAWSDEDIIEEVQDVYEILLTYLRENDIWGANYFRKELLDLEKIKYKPKPEGSGNEPDGDRKKGEPEGPDNGPDGDRKGGKPEGPDNKAEGDSDKDENGELTDKDIDLILAPIPPLPEKGPEKEVLSENIENKKIEKSEVEKLFDEYKSLAKKYNLLVKDLEYKRTALRKRLNEISHTYFDSSCFGVDDEYLAQYGNITREQIFILDDLKELNRDLDNYQALANLFNERLSILELKLEQGESLDNVESYIRKWVEELRLRIESDFFIELFPNKEEKQRCFVTVKDLKLEFHDKASKRAYETYIADKWDELHEMYPFSLEKDKDIINELLTIYWLEDHSMEIDPHTRQEIQRRKDILTVELAKRHDKVLLPQKLASIDIAFVYAPDGELYARMEPSYIDGILNSKVDEKRKLKDVLYNLPEEAQKAFIEIVLYERVLKDSNINLKIIYAIANRLNSLLDKYPILNKRIDFVRKEKSFRFLHVKEKLFDKVKKIFRFIPYSLDEIKAFIYQNGIQAIGQKYNIDLELKKRKVKTDIFVGLDEDRETEEFLRDLDKDAEKLYKREREVLKVKKNKVETGEKAKENEDKFNDPNYIEHGKSYNDEAIGKLKEKESGVEAHKNSLINNILSDFVWDIRYQLSENKDLDDELIKAIERYAQYKLKVILEDYPNWTETSKKKDLLLYLRDFLDSLNADELEIHKYLKMYLDTSSEKEIIIDADGNVETVEKKEKTELEVPVKKEEEKVEVLTDEDIIEEIKIDKEVQVDEKDEAEKSSVELLQDHFLALLVKKLDARIADRKGASKAKLEKYKKDLLGPIQDLINSKEDLTNYESIINYLHELAKSDKVDKKLKDTIKYVNRYLLTKDLKQALLDADAKENVGVKMNTLKDKELTESERENLLTEFVDLFLLAELEDRYKGTLSAEDYELFYKYIDQKVRRILNYHKDEFNSYADIIDFLNRISKDSAYSEADRQVLTVLLDMILNIEE